MYCEKKEDGAIFGYLMRKKILSGIINKINLKYKNI